MGPEVIVGVILAFAAAASLAMSMVVQRYALSYPEPLVPLICGMRASKGVVWFLGLVGYGVANGLYAASLQFGPLSLLASCFTSLLVFNLLFARLWIGEVLTLPKIACAVVILLGVITCVVGAASNVPTEFTPDDVETLLTEYAGGAVYLAVLFAALLSSVVGIILYERAYPLQLEIAPDGESPALDGEVPALDPVDPVDGSADEAASHREKPGPWLDRAMSVLYPASLGMDEGICHLTMKSAIAMLANCGDQDQCGRVIIYAFTIVWIAASLATVWWLRTVFARYETTRALPIEYGTVNACSVCSGLIFYRESQYMDNWQIVLNVVGLLIILVGIGVGNCGELPGSVGSNGGVGSDGMENAAALEMADHGANGSPNEAETMSAVRHK